MNRFVSDKDKKKFEEIVNKVYTKLTDLLGERYIINNMIIENLNQDQF